MVAWSAGMVVFLREQHTPRADRFSFSRTRRRSSSLDRKTFTHFSIFFGTSGHTVILIRQLKKSWMNIYSGVFADAKIHLEMVFQMKTYGSGVIPFPSTTLAHFQKLKFILRRISVRAHSVFLYIRVCELERPNAVFRADPRRSQ